MSHFCGRCGPPTEADKHAKVEFVRGYLDLTVHLCLPCYAAIMKMARR